MSYLRLSIHKLRKWSEALSDALEIDVVVTDKDLIRLVGTGEYSNRLERECSNDSIFASVIATGEPTINLKKEVICATCSTKETCKEFSNMAYPIKEEDKVVGLIAFSSFTPEQAKRMSMEKDKFFNMLMQGAKIIESEIEDIKINNKLRSDVVELNEIINSINKGIIIVDCGSKITNINGKALRILGLNISTQKIIDSPIQKFISNINLIDTDNKDKVEFWKFDNKEVKVRYSVNTIRFKDDILNKMISFDELEELSNIAKSYETKENINFENIIGESEAIKKAIYRAKVVAQTDSTILIEGESGTGKEIFARSIHNESLRKNQKFVAINCSSIPENLIESELFGYERGAFTGAVSQGKKGKFEIANNGTVFLDEIGELSPNMQVKLLRVLQERTIERVGGTEPIYINIRIISATNQKLLQLVKDGRFRLDLYYRLNVIGINLPNLRSRGEDVLKLSEYILEKMCDKMNVGKKTLSDEVRTAFLHYTWPGNIRELENVLENGIIFSEDEIIKRCHLPTNLLGIIESDVDSTKKLGHKNLESMKQDFERDVIDKLVEIYGDTYEGKKKISEILGIGMTTLYRKMNDYSKN